MTQFGVYTGADNSALTHALLAAGSGVTAGKVLSEMSWIGWLSKLFAKEPRREGREPRTLPVKVNGDNVKGVTRNLSLSGVYFEINSRYHVGSMIRMTIDFDSPRGMQLECEGTIVRVEGRGSDKVGVAVRMNQENKALILSKHASRSLEEDH